MISYIANMAIQVLIWLIIARSVLSFVPHDPHKPIWRFIYDVTEPMLKPFRRFSLSKGGMGVDFSPIIVILLLAYVVTPVVRALVGGF